MFKGRKKKASFEPPPDEPESYSEHQHEHDSQSYHQPSHQMARSTPQQILSSLISSPNDLASGVAMCIKALTEAMASPATSPVIVEYRGRRMAFGRKNLARMDGHDAMRMAVRAIYPHGNTSDTQVFIVQASLLGEDGREDRRLGAIGIDIDSWGELLPHIHSLYLSLNPPATSPRDRDRVGGDRDRDRGDRDRERAERERAERDRAARDRDRGDRDRDRDHRDRDHRPRRESGAERRDEDTHAEGLERSHSQNEGVPPPE